MQLYNDDVADNRKRLDKLSAGVEPVATFLFNVVFVFSVTVFQRCFSLCFRFLASRRSFSALLWWQNNRKCFSPLLWSRSRRGWPLHGQFRFRFFNLLLFFLLFSLTVRLHSHSLWTYSQSCAQYAFQWNIVFQSSSSLPAASRFVHDSENLKLVTDQT